MAKNCRDCVRCQGNVVKVWVARPWRVTKTVSGGALVDALRGPSSLQAPDEGPQERGLGPDRLTSLAVEVPDTRRRCVGQPRDKPSALASPSAPRLRGGRAISGGGSPPAQPVRPG